MDAYLEGRIAIVTGGFSGIGKAIAGALAERGATIAVGARRLPEEAIEALDEVADQLLYQRLDVADVNSIDAFIDGLAKTYGHADILVQPRELGALAAFLCHEDALGITMEDIQLNAAALW